MASWQSGEQRSNSGHLHGHKLRITRPPPLSGLFIPPGLKLLLRPSRPPSICPPCLAWPLVSIPGLKLALRASPASLPRSFLHAYTHAATHLLAQRPTSASPVTSPQRHAPSFNLPYRGRRLPRPAVLLSAVPAALPPLLAAGARPRAGPSFRPRAGALCLQHCWLARSSTLRWVFRGLLPPHASDGARPPLEPSAARPHTAAPLIPLLDVHFADHTGSLARARAVTGSTAPALGHAHGWPWPWPWRQQRVRRRRRGSARSFSNALLCPSGPPALHQDRL